MSFSVALFLCLPVCCCLFLSLVKDTSDGQNPIKDGTITVLDGLRLEDCVLAVPETAEDWRMWVGPGQEVGVQESGLITFQANDRRMRTHIAVQIIVEMD